MVNKLKVRGREITDSDIAVIRQLINEYFHKGRKYISRQLACQWKWYQANGQTKDMSCRYILLFLEKQGLIKLPPPRHSGNNEKRKVQKIELQEIGLRGKVNDHSSLRLELLNKGQEYTLWNRIIASYHYQGYQIIVGKFLKYIAYIRGNPIACLGWGSPSWSIMARDTWIGWSKKIKDKNLCGIVNNIRFLILPWIKIKNLASNLLGLSVKRLPRDWQKRYGHSIYLLETFVEKDRFLGTSYKAANWIYLGETKGSAKRGSNHYYHGNIKKIFVYPLCPNFRDKLKGNRQDEK